MAKNTNSVTIFLKNIFLAALIGVILSLIITMLLSCIIVNIDKHEIFYPTLTVVIQCIPALIAGKLIGRSYGHSLLVIGIVEGLIMSLILFLLSFSFFQTEMSFNSFLASLPYLASSAVLGSITSGKKKKKIK